MEDLFAGIDLGSVTTSMTIKLAAGGGDPRDVRSPSPRTREFERKAARRHVCKNDNPQGVSHAQKEFVFPAEAVDAVGCATTVAFCTSEHAAGVASDPRSPATTIPRGPGSTAAQELAFTLADGFAYVELALQTGLDVDEFRAAVELHFFNGPISTSSRRSPSTGAARRILGALDARSLRCTRREVAAAALSTRRPAGVSLTAQQPELNIARTRARKRWPA